MGYKWENSDFRYSRTAPFPNKEYILLFEKKDLKMNLILASEVGKIAMSPKLQPFERYIPPL